VVIQPFLNFRIYNFFEHLTHWFFYIKQFFWFLELNQNRFWREWFIIAFKFNVVCLLCIIQNSDPLKAVTYPKSFSLYVFFLLPILHHKFFHAKQLHHLFLDIDVSLLSHSSIIIPQIFILRLINFTPL